MRSGFESPAGTFGRVAKEAFASLFCLAAAVLPVALFARLLRAEGPLPLLLGWTGAASFLLRAALRIPQRHRVPAAILRSLAVLVLLSGIAIVLVQVNVARRSLAEAWLDLARKGEAFGFFSFFAAEVYALFVLGQSAFLSARKPLAWIASFAASNALCVGIIAGNGPLLALAVAAALALALALGDGPIRYRMVSLSVPFALAAALSLLYALYRNPQGERFRLPAPPDLTGLFAQIAPGFPLLVDVPGYGFSVGAGEMPSSVFLTTRPLWYVQGYPDTTHYLADERFSSWDGASWSPDPDKGGEIPIFEKPGDPAPETLALTLAEDFYSSVPVTDATVAIAFPEGIPPGLSARRNTGARFEQSIRRGQKALLLLEKRVDAGPPDETAGGFSAYLDTASNTPRMKGLAAGLLDQAGANARETADSLQRQYTALLLDHFAQGYEYSLEAGRPPAGAEVNDWFIFERKTGFCVYYASAFVMLAREAGIPARMAQGWRVRLGERGGGVITGSNAHAWPELYLDGAWRAFEPTPPYAQEDPFAYTREGDRATRRQLQALYGAEGEKSESSGAGGRRPVPILAYIAGGALAAAAAAWRILTRLFEGERSSIVREARKAVKRAERKGLPRPETTGWLAWKAAIPGILPEKKAERAAFLADRMIDLTYGGEGN